jgi:hypothetical protein
MWLSPYIGTVSITAATLSMPYSIGFPSKLSTNTAMPRF